MHYLVVNSTQDNWSSLPEHEIVESLAQKNLSKLTKRCKDVNVSFSSMSHISFEFEIKQKLCTGDDSPMDSNLTTDSCSSASPGWLAWLLFGIGALLEFTVLPGTLSFVLSFDSFNQALKVSTMPLKNCPPLRYGNGSYRPNERENHPKNPVYGTELNFSQVVLEERHWSQTELIIWLIMELIHSVPKYATRIFKFPSRRIKGAASSSKETTTLLSTAVTTSLLHEQAKMKKQCRLKESS